MRILKIGGTTIQANILHVLWNILSISSLPRVHDMSVNLEMQKRVVMSFFVLKKINKMQVVG